MELLGTPSPALCTYRTVCRCTAAGAPQPAVGLPSRPGAVWPGPLPVERGRAHTPAVHDHACRRHLQCCQAAAPGHRVGKEGDAGWVAAAPSPCMQHRVVTVQITLVVVAGAQHLRLSTPPNLFLGHPVVCAEEKPCSVPAGCRLFRLLPQSSRSRGTGRSCSAWP